MIYLNIKYKLIKALVETIILLVLAFIVACRPIHSQVSISLDKYFIIENYCTFSLAYSFSRDKVGKEQTNESLPKYLLFDEFEFTGTGFICWAGRAVLDSVKALPKHFPLKDIRRRDLLPNTVDYFYMPDNKLADFHDPFYFYPGTKITIWSKKKVFMVFDRDSLDAQINQNDFKSMTIKLCPENIAPAQWGNKNQRMGSTFIALLCQAISIYKDAAWHH